MKTFANADYTEGSYKAASRGITPHEHAVPTGTILYRFIDLSKGPSAQGADGAWWWEYEHYRTIETFAERNGYSLGYAARLFAAIFYEWSAINAVVRAEVVNGPLLTWKGVGKQVTLEKYDEKGKLLPEKREWWEPKPDLRDLSIPHGFLTEKWEQPAQPPSTRRMTPMQGPLEVLQLFIPGLGRPHNKFSSFMKLKGSPEHIKNHDPNFASP
jgi:hypothetical protein